MDDFDISPRLMACYSLKVLFERLIGAFSEQAIHDLYPKLLKRLDDSQDEVRLAICETLVAFYHCGPNSYYSTTLVEYSLDQLFLHLDDTDSRIQDAVSQVICSMKQLDRHDRILNKAEKNLTIHRTPLQCEKIINYIQGYEILEST